MTAVSQPPSCPVLALIGKSSREADLTPLSRTCDSPSRLQTRSMLPSVKVTSTETSLSPPLQLFLHFGIDVIQSGGRGHLSASSSRLCLLLMGRILQLGRRQP